MMLTLGNEELSLFKLALKQPRHEGLATTFSYHLNLRAGGQFSPLLSHLPTADSVWSWYSF